VLVGRAKSERYTDGQLWESAHIEARMAFDVSIVEPNSNSYSKRSGSNQSFFNANAGTRDAERTKVKKYKALCTQRGLTSGPIIIFTTSGAWERQSSDKFGIHTGRGSRLRRLNGNK
jgi:hypothetical protein